MSEFDYYHDLDSHPFTGERKVRFKAKISQADHLKGHFDGSSDHSQVENVTPGKVYDIHKVEGYGDVADYYFINDAGEEMQLADFFFAKTE